MNTLATELHRLVDAYLDGVLTLKELTDRTIARAQNAPLCASLAHDPTLAEALTGRGVQSIIARIAAMPFCPGQCVNHEWTIGPRGDTLSGTLLLSAENTAPPDGDNDWLMPTITFTLPPGTIKAAELTAHRRKLRSDWGLLSFDQR